MSTSSSSYHHQQQDSSITPQPFRWHYAEFDDSNFQIRGRTLFFAIVVFSIILLLGLIFLYARWACQFVPALPSPPPPSTSQLSIANPPVLSPRCGGLDPGAINSFPITLHCSSSSSSADGSECCICLGLFADGEKVKVLPQCHHCFHSECVDKWLANQSSCPLCRDSLRPDSLV